MRFCSCRLLFAILIKDHRQCCNVGHFIFSGRKYGEIAQHQID